VNASFYAQLVVLENTNLVLCVLR